jgi:hypothetical protein
MGTHKNKLKVTFTNVNAPILAAFGTLGSVGGLPLEKFFEAVSKGMVQPSGDGVITDGRLIFRSDNVSSWLMNDRIILNIPITQISTMYLAKPRWGLDYEFTLEHGGTKTDMVAIYGGRAFRDQLAADVRAAGGSVYSFG